MYSLIFIYTYSHAGVQNGTNADTLSKLLWTIYKYLYVLTYMHVFAHTGDQNSFNADMHSR